MRTSTFSKYINKTETSQKQIDLEGDQRRLS